MLSNGIISEPPRKQVVVIFLGDAVTAGPTLERSNLASHMEFSFPKPVNLRLETVRKDGSLP